VSPWLIVTVIAPPTVRAAAWMVAMTGQAAVRVALIVGLLVIMAGGAAWLGLRSRARSRHPSTS
jgi:hypothetical protein